MQRKTNPAGYPSRLHDSTQSPICIYFTFTVHILCTAGLVVQDLQFSLVKSDLFYINIQSLPTSLYSVLYE
jgi:hypothetical protein